MLESLSVEGAALPVEMVTMQERIPHSALPVVPGQLPMGLVKEKWKKTVVSEWM